MVVAARVDLGTFQCFGPGGFGRSQVARQIENEAIELSNLARQLPGLMGTLQPVADLLHVIQPPATWLLGSPFDSRGRWP